MHVLSCFVLLKSVLLISGVFCTLSHICISVSFHRTQCIGWILSQRHGMHYRSVRQDQPKTEGWWSKTTSVFQTKTRTGIIRPTQTAHSRTFCVQRRTSVGSGFGNSALNRNKDFRMWQHDGSKETDIWILLHFGLRNHLPQKNIMVKAKSNLGWLPGLL